MDPFILVKFSKADTTEGDPLASLVIFEWNDEELIGEYRSGDSEVRAPVKRGTTWDYIGADRKNNRSRTQSVSREALMQDFAQRKILDLSSSPRTLPMSPRTPYFPKPFISTTPNLSNTPSKRLVSTVLAPTPTPMKTTTLWLLSATHMANFLLRKSPNYLSTER